jgi:hypothetical protein
MPMAEARPFLTVNGVNFGVVTSARAARAIQLR